MITPCSNANMECPYFARNTPKRLEDEQTHGCFASTDHVIPRYLGRQAGASALLKNYIRSDANKQQLCRYEHDQKSLEDLQNPPEIPDERFMIDAIIKARRARRERKK